MFCIFKTYLLILVLSTHYYIYIYICKFSNETISSKSMILIFLLCCWTRKLGRKDFQNNIFGHLVHAMLVFALHSSIGSTIVLLYSKKSQQQKRKTYFLFQHNPLEYSLGITYSVWKSVLEISRDYLKTALCSAVSIYLIVIFSTVVWLNQLFCQIFSIFSTKTRKIVFNTVWLYVNH